MVRDLPNAGSGEPLRLLIVDDHEVVREGLVAALAQDDGVEVVAIAASGHEALSAVRRATPDVAIVDLRLPDITGDVLCGELRERFPRLAVVMLSSYASEDAVRAAMSAGAAAFIPKSAGLAELRDVLARVATHDGREGGQIVEQLHALLERRDDDQRPTPRQERVLDLAAEGLTYHEIGERLFISESTVRFHMQKLKSKFGARTKTDLIAKAIRAGVIAPSTEDRRLCP